MILRNVHVFSKRELPDTVTPRHDVERVVVLTQNVLLGTDMNQLCVVVCPHTAIKRFLFAIQLATCYQIIS
jgi:hypothetical protein